MQNVLDTGKRVFSAAIAAATIVFSIGAAGLISPLTAEAASGGDLIKGTSLTTVYYMGYDGLRYAFPNEKTYFSWYADFDDVMTISDTELASITLGGNVVIRPGTHFIKVTSDPKVYAVGRDGMLYWIESEEVAMDLAGSDWATNVIDVPDVFFDDYTVGTSLMTAMAFDGAIYEMGGTTYLSWDGDMIELTSGGMSDNNIWDKFVLDGGDIDDSGLTMGSTIDGEFLALMDAAQTEEGSTPVASGDLEISEASSMPNGVSLTGGANAVEVFSFDVEAGSEDATLDSVVLSMIGAGSPSNIADVYLYEGNTRLTESRTVNTSTREVTFSNLGWEIEAGDQRTFTARVTVSTTQVAADTFGFEITSEDDVTGSGDVGGSFPVSGDEFTLTGSDSGTIEVDKTGTIADPTIGADDAEIGMFKISANGTEGASVEMITLNIDDAADHDGFKLWDGTEFLVDGEFIGDDLVVFDLTDEPFEIEEGGNNIFSVSADIGGEDNDTIKVAIENAVDVVAIGTDFGFGMTVDISTNGSYGATGGSCTSSGSNCSFSTVVGGELTIAFNGPTSGDIQIDSQDRELLGFTITAAQEVTVKDLDIMIAADDDDDATITEGGEDATSNDNDGLINSGSEANFKDIKIVNAETGAVLLGPLELDVTTDDASDEDATTGAAEDALQIIDFTNDFVIEAGETLELMVTADIDNSLTAGETALAIFDISGLSVEDVNGDALSASDIVPGSDINGHTQTARAATLTFALSSNPGDQTIVDGATNVSVVAFNATAGDASDVTITDFTLSAYGDDDGSGTSTIGGATASDINDYVSSCSLYHDTTLLDGPESPSSNGQTFRFADIDWTIEAGDSDVLTVKCNFHNTSTAGSAYFTFDIADEDTDVVVEDDDGDTLAAANVLGDTPNGGTTLSSANVVTLADSGTLSVVTAPSMPSADFVLTGSSGNTVATYRFTANNEAFNIETLTFSEEQAEDDTGSANSSAYANNISTVTLEYPKADGSTGTKSVPLSGNEAKFSALDMYVPVGTPKEVMVKANLAATDRDTGSGATSNERIRMGLFVDTTNDDNFKAVGTGSDVTLDDDDQGAIGDDVFSTDGVPTFIVKETKPTIKTASTTPTTVTLGRSKIFEFTIAANSNESVVLSRMVFDIDTYDSQGNGTNDWANCENDETNGEMNPIDFDIYNLTDDNTSVTLDNSASSTDNDTVEAMSAGTNNPWTLLDTTGDVCGSTEEDVGFVALRLPTPEIIPSGETKLFAVYVDVSDASPAGNDTIRLSIPTDLLATNMLAVDNSTNETAIGITDTTIEVDAGTAFAVGDIIAYDETDADAGAAPSASERMLVTGISSNTLTVVRGYMGTQPVAYTSLSNTADDLYRLPSSFFWKDDGVSGHTGTADDFWGSYYLDDLAVYGNVLEY